MGAWDVLITLLQSRKRAGSTGSYAPNDPKISSIVIAVSVAVSQSIGFITSIVAAKYDTLISDRFGESSSTWIDDALTHNEYKDYISKWKSLSDARLVVCLLGWFG